MIVRWGTIDGREVVNVHLGDGHYCIAVDNSGDATWRELVERLESHESVESLSKRAVL